jgi:CRISPR-associated protein Csx17
MNTIPLHGCTPEPLMGYLKGLGVFRLVSEQADPACRAAWRDGRLMLHTKFDEHELGEFFDSLYVPTPIVVPWSGSDFFEVKILKAPERHTKTPTGSTIIEAFLANNSGRLSDYRAALAASIDALKMAGIARKEQMKGKQKAAFLAHLRSVSIGRVGDWIDAASVSFDDGLKLNPLLGSGGGSDGNTHFSDNFMQNIWDALPIFDVQKDSGKNARYFEESAARSRDLLRNSLFETPVEGLIADRTSSLFHSGAVGGPNASQGFERRALTNPWSFILTIEGSVALAGSMARRLGTHSAHAAFPFQTRASATSADTLERKEKSGFEVWLPLWRRLCSFHEVRFLLSEGRSEWNGVPPVTGVDFAKAVASLSVDRGIDCFVRFGIVKGRVGGDNYNTATPLGRFEVHAQEHVHLLREADSWIGRFRRACGDNAPERFHRALRRVDSAVFDYCRFGGAGRFQDILISLGQAERELAVSAGKMRKDGNCPVLQNLTADWVAAADDGSPEFEVAAALAGIRGVAGAVPGLRAHLEPVDPQKSQLQWAAGSASVVWKRGDLCANLAAVLDRRLVDARRLGLGWLPVQSPLTVRPQTIAAFIAGMVDDEKIENLLWGLLGCAIEWRPAGRAGEEGDGSSLHPLPRCYPLLKATLSGFHPLSRAPEFRDAHRAQNFEKLKLVKPDLRILQLIRANRLGEAAALSAQRLRNSELTPARIDWEKEPVGDGVAGRRLAASLLIPLSARDLLRLWDLVARREAPALEGAAT